MKSINYILAISIATLTMLIIWAVLIGMSTSNFSWWTWHLFTQAVFYCSFLFANTLAIKIAWEENKI